MMAWIKEIGPWSSYEPKVKALLAYAKKDGAKSLGCVGFCWGGWASMHTSAMTKDVKCAVIFHPSCQLEGAFGNDLGEFAKSAQAPMYFMPSKDEDKALYGDEGTFITGIKGAKTKYFEDMTHGYMVRAPLDGEGVKEAVTLGMKEAIAYLDAKLPADGKTGCGCL